MNPIEEAEKITEELGDVVFVGAVAVMVQLRTKHRRTRDIDLAMVAKLSKEELEAKGYRTYYEKGKEITYTPRNIKVDIFTKDVSRIPIETVYSTSVSFSGKNRTIKVACVEVLLIAKHRAARPQDIEDLQNLCKNKGKSINWTLLEEIAETTEMSEIKTVVNAFI